MVSSMYQLFGGFSGLPLVSYTQCGLMSYTQGKESQDNSVFLVTKKPKYIYIYNIQLRDSQVLKTYLRSYILDVGR